MPGHPEIFVTGDLAHLVGADGQPLPGVAQPAIQEGRYVGKLIGARLQGKTMPPFRYRDLGNLATIGRHAAVADLGWCRFSGWLAWWVWLFVHLMHIVQFHNRVLVLDAVGLELFHAQSRGKVDHRIVGRRFRTTSARRLCAQKKPPGRSS